MTKTSESTTKTSSKRGFKRFGTSRSFTAVERKAAVAAAAEGNDSEFLYYTGNPYRAKRKSRRFRTLSAAVLPAEVGTFVPFATVLDRATKAVSKSEGFDPANVRGDIYNHQNSKPVVYFLLERDGEGNYRAVKDIANPDPTVSDKPIEAGAVVFAAKKRAATRKKTAAKKRAAK
jgi:hypothetical protein